MLVIHNNFTEPYFNQAAEEYLLKNSDEDIFMLWRNDNAIIVGKHQNTLADKSEICEANNNVPW